MAYPKNTRKIIVPVNFNPPVTRPIDDVSCSTGFQLLSEIDFFKSVSSVVLCANEEERDEMLRELLAEYDTIELDPAWSQYEQELRSGIASATPFAKEAA